MSLTNESNGTKPKHAKPPKNTKQQTTTENKHIRLMSALVLNAKGADPKTNTEVKRGDEFFSSRSQYRTSRTRLHSACWQEGIPPKVHSVSVRMSRLKARVRFKSGSVKVDATQGTAQFVSKNAYAPTTL